MRPLPKHLRPHWRYLAIYLEAEPQVSLSRRDFQRHVWDAAKGLLGDVGAASVDLRVYTFRWEQGSGAAIVRTDRDYVSDARAVIASIDCHDNHPIGLRIAGVSGTVKSCEEKYLGRQLEPIEERTVVFENGDRRAWVRGQTVDILIDNDIIGATTLDIE